jgi:hypothetical protein
MSGVEAMIRISRFRGATGMLEDAKGCGEDVWYRDEISIEFDL